MPPMGMLMRTPLQPTCLLVLSPRLEFSGNNLVTMGSGLRLPRPCDAKTKSPDATPKPFFRTTLQRHCAYTKRPPVFVQTLEKKRHVRARSHLLCSNIYPAEQTEHLTIDTVPDEPEEHPPLPSSACLSDLPPESLLQPSGQPCNNNDSNNMVPHTSEVGSGRYT